jgi:hypothetical protein
MSRLPSLLQRTKHRTPRRAASKREDAEAVFKDFVRTLERLRAPARGGGHAAIAATREKA